MAQKNKTQSKVRTPKAAPPAAKKASAKTTKGAKTVKPVTAAKKESKAPDKAAKKPAAKVAAKKPAEPKAAAAKPADVKTVAARAPAKAAKAAVAPKAVAESKAASAPKAAAAPKAPVAASKVAPAGAKPVQASAAASAPKAPAKAAVASKGKAASARAVAAAVAQPAGEKISAPAPAAKPQEKKGQRHGFKLNEYVVYPAHGVGRIVGIEEQEIAGHSLELFVITFEKEKLTLRVPTGKLESVGMRKLSEGDTVKKAMETLKGRARIKRTMWSRRAQEYVAKINSGSLVAIAEVVRDLYRSEAQPEQSYSERQLYEDALDRMARELAAVEKLDERGAVQRITDVLSKSARGRRAAAEVEEAEEAEAA